MSLLQSKIKSILSIFLLVISFCAIAQTPGWTSYNATTVVYDAAFENNYLWVVSTGGITKFDTISKACTYYNQFNSGLPTPNVFSLAIDASNNKWFGTGGGPTGTTEAIQPGAGLVKFDGTNWTVYNTSNSGLANNTVRALYIDAAGVIWAGTYSGLSKFDGVTWTTFNKINSGLPSDSVTSITVDNFGKKWIGTFHGLASFDDVVWGSYKRATSGIPCDTIRTIAVDDNNIKWVGTSRGGLGKFDDLTWTTYNVANSGLPNNNVTAILPESNGNFWLGTYGTPSTYGGGIAKFDGTSTWTIYNVANSDLPKDNVPVIIADHVGNKWVISERGQRHGAGTGQVSKFDEVTWATYSITNSGSLSNFTYHITKDNSNNLWFGGEKAGLTKYDGTSWQNYNSDNSAMIDDDILDIRFDATGNLWAVHDWGKLLKFDGTAFSYTTFPLGAGDDPRCLFIDENSDKWAGTLATGIYVWDNATWTNFNTATSGLPNDKVYSITADTAGTKWIGTYGGGLAKYDGTTWTVYNTSTSGLLSNNVNYVEVDEFQNKWVATQNGLGKFDGTTWTIYRTVNSGLPSNVVYCVAFDPYGVLWAGTSNGVAKFDGTTWTTYNYTTPANFAFRHINFDSVGNVWIGTYGRGIVKVLNPGITTTIASSKYSESDILLNYPNPFSDETTIAINADDVQQPDFSFMIYDALGRKVNCLYSINKDATNSYIKVYSSDLNSGIYYYTLSADNKIKSGKMVIQK